MYKIASLALVLLWACRVSAQAGAPVIGRSAPYRDCDATIRDALAGAEHRSPSECEVKFDRDVKEAFRKALAPVILQLRARHWIPTDSTSDDPLSDVGRGTEQRLSGLGTWFMRLMLDPVSEEALRIQTAYQQALEKAKSEAAADPAKAEAAYATVRALGNRAASQTQLQIEVRINEPRMELVDFKNGFQPFTMPSLAHALRAPFAQAQTGGGIDDARDVTILLTGPWQRAKQEAFTDGSGRWSIPASYPRNAPLLSVQSISIRIEGEGTLARKLATTIDWNTLRGLISH